MITCKDDHVFVYSKRSCVLSSNCCVFVYGLLDSSISFYALGRLSHNLPKYRA